MKVVKIIIQICLLVFTLALLAGVAYIFGILGLIVGLLSASQIILLIQQNQMKKMIKELYEKSKSYTFK